MYRLALIASLFAVCLLSGCGAAKVDLVPVTGKVLIDGKPAANIVVMFTPKIVDENVVAVTSQGTTNENGEFELFTVKNEPGAMPGVHRVSLIDAEEERAGQGEEETKPLRLDPSFASGKLELTVIANTPLTIEANGPR